jgi:hypothetical protein
MNQKSNHPNNFLAELLAKGGRPMRLRNLQSIHELCRLEHESGSREISVASIGKLCEREGILKARGLYNAPLADYRALILCWAEFAGPPVAKPVKALASDDFISRIDDPAIRAMVQKVVAERNKLKAQLDTLKSNTTMVIDRRPTTRQNSEERSAIFTDSERRALAKAISPDFLADHKWREVDLGEVVNSYGRTVFDPGFATAIRKIINN